MKSLTGLYNFQVAMDCVLATCKHFGLTPAQLASRSRRWRFCWPRFVAMFLIREQAQYSNSLVAELFDLDNAAIRHGIQRVREQIEVSREARYDVDTVRAAIARHDYQI